MKGLSKLLILDDIFSDKNLYKLLKTGISSRCCFKTSHPGFDVLPILKSELHVW